MIPELLLHIRKIFISQMSLHPFIHSLSTRRVSTHLGQVLCWVREDMVMETTGGPAPSDPRAGTLPLGAVALRGHGPSLETSRLSQIGDATGT